jgi:hypothetical protein
MLYQRKKRLGGLADVTPVHDGDRRDRARQQCPSQTRVLCVSGGRRRKTTRGCIVGRPRQAASQRRWCGPAATASKRSAVQRKPESGVTKCWFTTTAVVSRWRQHLCCPRRQQMSCMSRKHVRMKGTVSNRTTRTGCLAPSSVPDERSDLQIILDSCSRARKAQRKGSLWVSGSDAGRIAAPAQSERGRIRRGPCGIRSMMGGA